MQAEILKNRLNQLGWSRYRLTKEYCRAKGEEPDVTLIKKYDGKVKRALEKPDKVSFEVIKHLVIALDGELIMRWNIRQEVIISQEDVRA